MAQTDSGLLRRRRDRGNKTASVLAATALVAASLTTVLAASPAAAGTCSGSEFTTSCDYTVPAGASVVKVIAIGGGGGSGGASSTGNSASAGNGALVTAFQPVAPGDTLAVTVGLGGAAGTTTTGGSGRGGYATGGDGSNNDSATTGGGGGGGGSTAVIGPNVEIIAGGGGGGGAYSSSATGSGAGGSAGTGSKTSDANGDYSAGGRGSSGAAWGDGGSTTSPGSGGVSGTGNSAVGGSGANGAGAGGLVVSGGSKAGNGGGGAGYGGGGGGGNSGVNGFGGGGGGSKVSANSLSTSTFATAGSGMYGPGGAGRTSGPGAGNPGNDGYVSIEALSQPTITGTAPGDTTATITWTEPTQPNDVGTVSYQVYKDGTPVLGATSSPATVNGLTNGQTYAFTVVATSTESLRTTSDASNVIPATPSAPDQPTNVAAQPLNGQASITWDTPASPGTSPIIGYKVEKNSGSGWSAVIANTGVVNNYLVTGLANSTTYAFRVSAINDVGTSAAASSNSATPSSNLFISDWDTDSTSDVSTNHQIKLPLVDPNNYSSDANYNFAVYWGDGTSDTITAFDDPAVQHTYAVPGTYTLSISGTIKGWAFGADGGPGDAEKLQDISQWGSLAFTQNSSGAFYFAEHLNPTATDKPDTSSVQNMEAFFRNATTFDADISNWDTSHVTNMNSLFDSATSFNKQLTTTANGWTTANVVSALSMFDGATAYEGAGVSSWDTSQLQEMQWMFRGATAFDGNVSNWNVSGVSNLNSVFEDATRFNRNLSSWDTSNVTIMTSTFKGATSFNSPLVQHSGGWTTTSVTDMKQMFAGATSFNQKISSWNVTGLTASFQHGAATDMFQNVTLSTANYNALLIGWSAQSVKSGIQFSGGNSQYSPGTAATARSALQTKGWTITDGGEGQQIPPDNDDLPVITGGAQVGSQLAVSDGTWTSDPAVTSYAYQWQSCADSTCTAATDITGATSQTFVPTVAAVGKYVRARVSATNTIGTTAAFSDATGPIAASVVPMVTVTAAPATTQVVINQPVRVNVTVSEATKSAGGASVGNRSVRTTASGSATVYINGITSCTAVITNGRGSCRAVPRTQGGLSFTASFTGTVNGISVTATSSGGSASRATSATVAIQLARASRGRCINYTLAGRSLRARANVSVMMLVRGKWRTVAMSKAHNSSWHSRVRSGKRVARFRVTDQHTFTAIIRVRAGQILRGDVRSC